MSLTDQYETWKLRVKGIKPLDIDNSGSVDCVDMPKSWALFLWPGTPWQTSVGYGDARFMFDNASPAYFDKLRNTGGIKPSVTPKQGDIAVYGLTPSLGFANQYDNPYGHVGVVDSVYAGGVVLLQQDSSQPTTPPYLRNRDYSFAPLIGLLRPKELLMEQQPYNPGDAVNVANDTGTPQDIMAGKKDWNDAYYSTVSPKLRAQRERIALLESTTDPAIIKLAEAIKALKG